MQVLHAGHRAAILANQKMSGAPVAWGEITLTGAPFSPGGQDVVESGGDGDVGTAQRSRVLERGLVGGVNDLQIKALLLEEALLQAELGVRGVPRAAIRYRDPHGLGGGGDTWRRARQRENGKRNGDRFPHDVLLARPTQVRAQKNMSMTPVMLCSRQFGRDNTNRQAFA